MSDLKLKIRKKDRELLYAYGFLTWAEQNKENDEIKLETDHWAKIIAQLRQEGNMKRLLSKNVQTQFTMEMFCKAHKKKKRV